MTNNTKPKNSEGMPDAMNIIDEKITMCVANMTHPELSKDAGLVAFWEGHKRDFDIIKQALNQSIPRARVEKVLAYAEEEYSETLYYIGRIKQRKVIEKLQSLLDESGKEE